MSRTFYPGELRAIVHILDGLDAIDAVPDPKADGAVGLKSGTEVWNHEDGICIGTIVDEVGGAWSFTPGGAA